MIGTGFQKWFVDGVIGRRGSLDTASSLLPCHRPFLKPCLWAAVFLLFILFTAFPVMSQEKPSVRSEQPALEPSVPNEPAPMTDIHDILPPVAVGFDVSWRIPALIALAVVLLLGAAWWLWKKYRKKKGIETVVPELPPELLARQGLDEINDVRRWEGKAFYFRLSAILRQYVFGRFAVGAPEMTTEEFLPCIDGLSLEKEMAMRLRQLCRAMDPVKFGDASVMEKQMEQDLMFAREFVRKTTQMAEEQDGRSPSATTGHSAAGQRQMNLQHRTSDIEC
jgi:hypothetical protein